MSLVGREVVGADRLGNKAQAIIRHRQVLLEQVVAVRTVEIAQAKDLQLAEALSKIVHKLHRDGCGAGGHRDFLEIARRVLAAGREDMMFERFDQHARFA